MASANSCPVFCADDPARRRSGQTCAEISESGDGLCNQRRLERDDRRLSHLSNELATTCAFTCSICQGSACSNIVHCPIRKISITLFEDDFLLSLLSEGLGKDGLGEDAGKFV